MKIKEKIQEISKIIQYKRKGRQLELLNKNIEMMTLEEVNMELGLKLSKINKLNEIDSRTEELINYIFQVKNGNATTFLLNMINFLKNDDLKLDFLDRFAGEINDEALKDMRCGAYDTRFEKDIKDDTKARRERRINDIKIAINKITVRLGKKNRTSDEENGFFGGIQNPLELKIKNDEYYRLQEENRERSENIKAKIFAKNYERLNIYEILRTSEYLLIEKMCKELPEDIKSAFVLEYLNFRTYKFLYKTDEERLENLILETVPIDILKNQIISNIGRLEKPYINLLEKIEISFSDIQNYYRRTGKIPELYWYGIEEPIEIEIETAEEVIGELKYFEDGEKEKFFFLVIGKLNEDELEKVLESDEVGDGLKAEFYRSKAFEKNDTEKLEIYQKLLLMEIHEKAKNNYRISIANINGKYDEMLEIIKSGQCDYWHLSNEGVLLKLSDEQLKEIYDVTENCELRANLLTLSRRRKSNLFGWGEDEEQEEQEEEFDEFILVKKENYADFIRNAKSYNEISELFSYRFEKYKKEIPFEQVLELYQDFCKKELKIDNDNIKHKLKEECLNYFKFWIMNDLTIENYFKLIEIGYPKKDLEDASKYCVIKEDMKIEEVESYIQNIAQIQDLDLKEKIFKRLIDKYLSMPYFMTESSEDYKKYENRVADLENLYEKLLESNDVDISNKYFILSQYMKEYYSRVRCEDKKFIDKFESRFRNLNEEAGKSEYTEIFDFAPIYKSGYDGRDINVTNYDNIIECIKNLGSDIVHKKLVDLYNQNHSIKQNICPALIKEDVIQLLDDELMEFVSRYSVNASSFSEILRDENKANLFVKTYDRMKNIKAYSENDALEIAKFIARLSEQELAEEIDEKNLDLIIAISLSEKLKNKYFEMQVNEDQNKFEKYIENIKEEARQEIHSPLLTRRQALDAIGTRFFGLSYDEMQDMVNKYTVDLAEMIQKYKEKDSLTEEEQNELKTLKVLKNIKEILAIQDKKILAETFEELDKLEEFKDIDFALANVLDENIRRVYAKDYKENVYCLDEKDKLEQKVDGIDIYSPKEFNMLVHVVSAYGDFKLIDKENPEKSAKEFWRNVDDKKNHILCTSYIGNSNLCYAKPSKQDKSKAEPKVIFGFSNFSKNSVLMAAPYDIGSDTTAMKSNRSYHSSSFRTAKNMIKNTRWHHNEVCVERRLENQKDVNIEPDYIVCFDEISEESKKVAKDFGIPIVLLDTNEIAKNESEKLEELFKEFYKTKDVSKISEILSLYQSNINGFSSYKDELVEKYFSYSKMNENIEKMMQCIEKEYKLGNRDNAIRCYEVLHKAFQEEIRLNLERGIDPEENTKGQFKIREFNYLARQKFEKVKHQLSDSTTIVEQTVDEDKVFEVVSGIKERNRNNGR